MASLNSATNPWIYLCFSSAVLQQVKVRRKTLSSQTKRIATRDIRGTNSRSFLPSFAQRLVGFHSTLGGPDSVGGADADRRGPAADGVGGGGGGDQQRRRRRRQLLNQGPLPPVVPLLRARQAASLPPARL